jgi:hypothetical protein
MAGRRDLALAALLVAVGIGAWLHWSITDPSFDQTEAQSEWGHVLAFSALILGLTGGAAALGRRLSEAPSVRRLTVTLFAAGTVAALTNVIEDGLGVEGAFFVFILLTGVELVTLIGLAVALALRVGGPRRLLALAPLGNAAGVILYVKAGGPILLGTWCAAAVYLAATGRDARVGSR